MYSPLSQTDTHLPSPSSPTRGRSRTPSPLQKRNLTNVRRWWLVLSIFLAVLIFITLSLHSPALGPGVPVLQAIKPIPETHLLADALVHKVPPSYLSLALDREPGEVSRKEGGSCTPVQKVGFMKTHKTASSTVQNILMRFALNSAWNFVVYEHGSHLGPPSNQYSLTKTFSSEWVKGVAWNRMVQEQGYNMFALHTKWDQIEVEKVLGDRQGPDRVGRYVTILRDPVDQFESLYNYVHFDKNFHMGLEEFVKEFVKKRKDIKRVNDYLGRNQQLWDLGLAREDINNHNAVKEKVKQVGKDFDLVMIAEDFSSSLVLLSEVLCWPLSNMTSLKINARKKSAKEKLSPESREILKDWLWADYLLYDYFKDELQRKKKAFGTDHIEKKVEELGQLNENLKKDCVLETVKNTNSLSSDFKPWSKDVIGFKIDEEKDYCKYFGLAEVRFIDHIRTLQAERGKKWLTRH